MKIEVKNKKNKKIKLLDADKLKDIFIRKFRKNLKEEIDAANFMKAPNSIKKSVRFSKTKKGLKFTISAVGMIHNVGVRKHKMKYLLKAKKAIPIIDKRTSKVIFRRATPKSMKTGWNHPGMKPKKFIEKAFSRSNKEFRARMGRSVKMQLKKYIYMR